MIDAAHVLRNPDGSPLRVKLFAGQDWSALLDVTNPQLPQLIWPAFERLQQQLRFGGLELALDGPDNRVDGSLDGCPYTPELEQPVYRLGGQRTQLSSRTACMGALGELGNQYELHNFYSYAHATMLQR